MNSAIIEQVTVDGRVNSLQAVRAALDLLKEVTISGYIPFSSPAPSSTEVNVRDQIRRCIQQLDGTISLMDMLPHNREYKPQSGPCGECRYCRRDGRCMVYGCDVYEKSIRACFGPKDDQTSTTMKVYTKNLNEQEAADLLKMIKDAILPERPKKKKPRMIIVLDPDSIQDGTILGEEEVELR